MLNLLSYGTLPDDLLEHIKVSSMPSDVLRDLGYSLLVALAKLIDGVYAAVNFLLKLDLYTLVKNKFPGFFAAIPTLVWAVFGLAILIAGLKLTKNRNKGEASKYIDGILTTALLIVAFPFLINAMADLSSAGVDDVSKLPIGSRTGSIGETMLAGVTLDVNKSKKEMTYLNDSLNTSPYYIDINKELPNDKFWDKKITSDDFVKKSGDVGVVTILTQYFGLDRETVNIWKDFDSLKLSTDNYEQIKNTLGEKAYDRAKTNCMYVNDLFAEFYHDIINWKRWAGNTIKPDKLTAYYNTEYLTTEEDLEDMSWNEKIVAYIEALGNPVEHIYAYDYHFFNGLVMMLTTLVALIFAALKVGKLLFDLIFNQTIAPLVIASDITNEGRRKYILQNIFSIYLVFIVILFVIKLYIVVILYTITSDFPVAVQIALMLSGMAFVIDGPDSIIKLLGIDAGVKSGGHAAMAAMSAVQTASNVAGTATSLVRRGGEAAVSVGARGLSGTMAVASTVGNSIKSVGTGISKGAELGNKIGVGGVAGGIAGGVAGVAGGVAKTAGTAAVETLKTAKTAVQGTAHTLSNKYDIDRQAVPDAKNRIGRAFSRESDVPVSNAQEQPNTNQAEAPSSSSSSTTAAPIANNKRSSNSKENEAKPKE